MQEISDANASMDDFKKIIINKNRAKLMGAAFDEWLPWFLKQDSSADFVPLSACCSVQ